MLTVVDVLLRTERFLRERGVDTPRLEAELLIGDVLKLSRMQLYLAHDRPLDLNELEHLRGLVARRGKREPLAYIVGSQPFHAIDLAIVPGVLIPRQDTETLVEAAIEWFGAATDPLYVADVGCGSGAVGLALAHRLPHLRLYATDRSDIALQLTRQNRDALGMAQRVAVLEGDLLNAVPLDRPIDWVVSNPPYIPSSEIPGLQPEVSQYEPRLALDGGLDGLDVYRRLLPEAAKRARRGCLVEVGQRQAAQVSDLMRRAGFSSINVWNDLAGIARVVGGRHPV